jgi:tRNA-Thr(GGU) m(6)t(6)A37 methyltransferase TsaA
MNLWLKPVGRVESTLVDLAQAPRQGDEGGPDAWLVFDPSVTEAMQDLRAGDDVLVLTWLDRAERTTQVVYPRGDQTRARQGVFSTRSPHRPNPIGLHRVKVIQVDGLRVYVSDLEAIDGTPILDVKPVLGDER